MEDEKINWGLAAIAFFLGWFGIDKLYVLGFKKGWKLFVLKFLANFIGLGELWNILDIIMIFVKKYEANPLDYLTLIENRNK